MPEPATAVLSDLLSRSWREALGRVPAGPDADFFAAGGDSLLIVRIVAQLRGTGVVVGPADFLRGRTFAGILDRLDERNPNPPRPVPPGTDDRELATTRTGPSTDSSQSRTIPATGPVPLLPAQWRWITSRFDDPDHFVREWVFQVPIKTPGGHTVDAARIEAALRELTRRHDALRTRYQVTHADRPAAEVLARAPGELLETLDTDDDGVAGALRRGLTSHRLNDGRVIAATWLSRQRLLQVTVHNLTLDGYSITVLADQFEDLLTGREPAPPVSQPRDWAADLAVWRASDQAQSDLSAWAALGWDEVRRIPAEATGPGLLSSMASASAELDPAATDALRQAARDRGQPVDLFVLAAAGTTIASHFRMPAVSVDTYHHGRDGIPGGHDVTSTFGYLQCTYPVVVPASAEQPWIEPAPFLDRVPDSRFGFDALRSTAALTELPASDVRLVFRSRMNDMNARQDRWLRPAPLAGPDRRSPRQREPHLLMLYADLVRGGLSFTVKYSRDHFRPDTARTLATATVATLATIGRSGPPPTGTRPLPREGAHD